MARKSTNIKSWSVMAGMCPTCPFKTDKKGIEQSPEIAGMVKSRCVTEASQICHHPALQNKPETHLCRGARDFQLQIFYRLGVLSEPTDAAWEQARERLSC